MTTHCYSAHKVEDRQIWDKLRAQLSGKPSIDSVHCLTSISDTAKAEFGRFRGWTDKEDNVWSWVFGTKINKFNWEKNPFVASKGESWRNHLPQGEGIRNFIELPSENHGKHKKQKTTISSFFWGRSHVQSWEIHNPIHLGQRMPGWPSLPAFPVPPVHRCRAHYGPVKPWVRIAPRRCHPPRRVACRVVGYEASNFMSLWTLSKMELESVQNLLKYLQNTATR